MKIKAQTAAIGRMRDIAARTDTKILCQHNAGTVATNVDNCSPGTEK